MQVILKVFSSIWTGRKRQKVRLQYASSVEIEQRQLKDYLLALLPCLDGTILCNYCPCLSFLWRRHVSSSMGSAFKAREREREKYRKLKSKFVVCLDYTSSAKVSENDGLHWFCLVLLLSESSAHCSYQQQLQLKYTSTRCVESSICNLFVTHTCTHPYQRHVGKGSFEWRKRLTWRI